MPICSGFIPPIAERNTKNDPSRGRFDSTNVMPDHDPASGKKLANLRNFYFAEILAMTFGPQIAGLVLVFYYQYFLALTFLDHLA